MKTIIFTQADNIDGISCAIIAKLVDGDDCEIVLSSQETINDDFINKFNIERIYDDDLEIDSYNITGNDQIKTYDKIYVTDLCIYGELLRKFGRAANSLPKLKIFDHHDFAFIKGVNHYTLNFKIDKSDEKGLCSSTSLYYEYLKSKGLIESNKKLNQFVELVRLCDTLDDSKEKIKNKAEKLQLLFDALGGKNFASSMMEKIVLDNSEEFDFSQEELKIIEKQKEKQENNEKE